MISFLFPVWFKRSIARQTAALRDVPLPPWGLGACVSAFVCALLFFLRFHDRSWRHCRLSFASEDALDSLAMVEAYEHGFRSFRDYDFALWLQKRELPRLPALSAGQPVLALPEGRESVLTKQIDAIDKESNRGCGQYFELYHARFLRALRSLKSGLTEYDRPIFARLLSVNGWDISDDAFHTACREEDEVLAEIRAGYE